MKSTKSKPKQGKIGVPIETYQSFKEAASDSKRKIAQVAEIAIQLYRDAIRDEKPIATMRSTQS